MNAVNKTFTDGSRVATGQLDDLSIHAGSPVDKGDNPEAHIMLAKQKDSEPEGIVARFWKWAGRVTGVSKDAYGNEGSPLTLNQVMARDAVQAQYTKLHCAMMESFYGILRAPPEQQGALLKISVEEFAAGMKSVAPLLSSSKREEFSNILGQLQVAAGDTTKRAAFAAAVEKLESFTPGDGVATDGSVRPSTAQESTMKLSYEEALKAMTPEQRTAVEEAMKGKPPFPPEDEEDKKKKSAAEIKKQAEIDARFEKLEKRAEGAETELAKLRAEKSDGEFITKARALNVRGVPESDVATTLKSAYAVSKEAGETAEKTFRALAAQTAKNTALTRAVGTSAVNKEDDGAVNTGAHQLLQAKAAELRKSNPKLSEAQAYRQASKMDRELAKRAVAEQTHDLN